MIYPKRELTNMRSKIYVFCILIITIFVYFGACRKAGTWLVKEDVPVHADAIVILMGSISDRVLQTVDLYKQGLARKVIIVEESMGANKALEARGIRIISNTNQVLNALATLGVPADSIIILPGDATSTQMEAEIIRKYIITKPDIDTLLLVSSAPHTRRASMIFKSAFRKAKEPIAILCSPSAYTNFDAKNWWRNKEGIQTVLMEYVKMANFVLFDRRELKKEKVNSR
jgi:uncharacterized SAM-binding protein YcdF (DUF218 family)